MFKTILDTIIVLTETLGLKELFKGKEAKLQDFQLKLAEKITEANKMQVEVNKIEAKHQSIFVSGWRPFIGWSCGSALAYNFIIQPLLYTFLQLFNVIIQLPKLEIEQLVGILLAMLGMSGYRTYEKIKLKNNDRPK